MNMNMIDDGDMYRREKYSRKNFGGKAFASVKHVLQVHPHTKCLHTTK